MKVLMRIIADSGSEVSIVYIRFVTKPYVGRPALICSVKDIGTSGLHETETSAYNILMNDNSKMRAAQANKRDEFYTMRPDVERELPLYREQFRGKRVFLPCDGSESAFFRFFLDRFSEYGIAEVRASRLSGSGSGFCETWSICADGVRKTVIPDDDGDFRTSRIVAETLRWSDIVVTNPPFSLFREFMLMLFASGKHFIVLGNMNQILTKDIFPFVVSSRLRFGPSIYSGDRTFLVPDGYPLETSGAFVENGKRYIKVKGVRWFTDMLPDSPAASRALVPKIRFADMEYERFDYMPDVICVNRTQDIPADYDGLMGVPLTYFDRHNPDMFEIVDGINRYLTLDTLGINGTAQKNGWHLLTVNGKIKYFRFLIRRKN